MNAFPAEEVLIRGPNTARHFQLSLMSLELGHLLVGDAAGLLSSGHKAS